MEEITIINRNDMVNYICVSMLIEGIEIDESLVHSILDSAEDYRLDYGITHNKEE